MKISNKFNSFCRASHKWLGIAALFFLTLFCISGIILNHRDIFGKVDVSRNLLPPSYKVHNFNQGVARGTLSIGGDSILLFGNSGIWLNVSGDPELIDFNKGLPSSVSSRNVRNIVATPDGQIWAGVSSGVYRLQNGIWNKIPLPGNGGGVSDVAVDGTNGNPVVITRSAVYSWDGKAFEKVSLPDSPALSRDVTLFKVLMNLHSGELFGMPGVYVVDFVALVLIFLCISGIIIFILLKKIKMRAKKKISVASQTKRYKYNFKWHRRVGLYSLLFTLIIAVTGICLRPPLMIPCVMTKVAPVPGTKLDLKSPWQGKLRAIRWDSNANRWLLSTTDGFFWLSQNFTDVEAIAKDCTPKVSPMGVTVLEQRPDGKWLVGSFSGLFLWNPTDHECVDCHTGKKPVVSHGRPLSDHLVAGISNDFGVVFDQYSGAEAMEGYLVKPDTSGSNLLRSDASLADAPVSLWNYALEVHSGRIYGGLLGPAEDLFIFFSGLAFIILLLSGLWLFFRTRIRART